MPSNGQPASKYWCFTLNTPTPDECFKATDLLVNLREPATYLVIGQETAPDTGRLHLQGYIELKSRTRLNGVKQLFEGFLMRAHLEPAKGSAEQNLAYCSKENLLGETGIPKNQGKPKARNDLQYAAGLLLESRDVRSVARELPTTFIRYHKGLSALLEATAPTPDYRTNLQVFVFWGSTGTGKTRTVHDTEPDLWTWGGDRWFDGYRGQQAALFDDYNGHFELSYFLKVLDKYPFQVPIKGGFVQWIPQRIYITSNKPFTDWYPQRHPEHLQALERRITEIREFN